MNVKGVALCSALLLSGCVTVTSEPVTLPSGEQGHAIKCNGTARSMADCMNYAAKLCGGPYEPVEFEQSSPGAYAAPAGSGAILVAAQKRTMLVRCGEKAQTN